MRFFLLLIFLVLSCICTSHAQPPDHSITETPGDTIEGESTDTTIVYIIKKAPVRIKERIEIQRNKLKKHLYFTTGISVFTNTNTYKANSGTKEYIDHLNSSTGSKMGYATLMQLYNAPEKNILGIMIEGKRINEWFRYTPSDGGGGSSGGSGTENIFENSYTYGSFGIMVGRWYRKNNKISYQLICTPTMNGRYGLSGYSLNPQNDSATIFIDHVVLYHLVYPSVNLSCKLLYRTKNSFIEIVPYANITLFSMTNKREVFAIRRQIVGLSISLTNKIF